MDHIDLVGDFLKEGKTIPMVDVRSPSEFAHGHIPGAVNIPLFDDRERAIVGTTYVQVGRKEAIDIGVDLAYPKMKSIIDEGRTLAPGRKLLVHCWRGGMRSNAVANFFSIAGFETAVLTGGYKAYRRHIHAAFEKQARLVIVGGLTGSGKSEILQRMQTLGSQVLDLEALANHKGSVFGGIGRTQPTNEQFENNLYGVWSRFDLSKIIFVEDESLCIGRCVVPEAIFKSMKLAPSVVVNRSRQTRIARIVEEYGPMDDTELIHACDVLKKKLGNENHARVIAAIESGNFALAVPLLLDYYDRLYSKAMEKRTTQKIEIEAGETMSLDDLCAEIVEKSAALTS